ncbi:MAG: O-antigen ligase family protein [Acidiferrobacterales bacterium]
MLWQKQSAVITASIPVTLVWLCIAALPFGRSAEVPNIIMAVSGVALMIGRGPAFFWYGTGRQLTILFLFFWLPMAISLAGAVDPGGSLQTVLLYPRFYFSGLFMVATLSQPKVQQRLLAGLAWLLVFWVTDALAQVVIGYDLFGFKLFPARLNGIFGEYHLRFGIVLGALAALLFVHARRRWNRTAQTLALVATVVAVLLSGSRAAWIMVAVAIVGRLAITRRDSRQPVWKPLVAAVALLVTVLPIAYYKVPGFPDRVQRSLLILKGDRHSVDEALSLRLPIWATSIRMIEANPVFGVGVRGYRYAYPQYARPGDVFVAPDRKTGANYAHQELLEAASETGVIGVSGFVLFMAGLARMWWRSDAMRRRAMEPYGLVLLAALFPLNTHMAVYSSFWGQIIWWTAAIYCACGETSNDAAAAVGKG